MNGQIKHFDELWHLPKEMNGLEFNDLQDGLLQIEDYQLVFVMEDGYQTVSKETRNRFQNDFIQTAHFEPIFLNQNSLQENWICKKQPFLRPCWKNINGVLQFVLSDDDVWEKLAPNGDDIQLLYPLSEDEYLISEHVCQIYRLRSSYRIRQWVETGQMKAGIMVYPYQGRFSDLSQKTCDLVQIECQYTFLIQPVEEKIRKRGMN